MTEKTIGTGTLLLIIGVVFGILSDASSFTKWIVAIFGVLFLVLGMAARANEGLRHHIMHAAAALALIGILATIGGWAGRGFGSTLAVLSQLALVVMCAGYLFTAVQSFRAAAAARRAGTG